MSLTIRAVGHAGRRGATRRVPTAAAMLASIAEWLPDAAGDALRGFAPAGRATDGALRASFHPAARPVRITADDRGRVVVSALTVPVGPGYHTFLVNLLERLGDELSITWAPLATPATPSSARVAAPAATDPDGSIDPTGAFGSGDRRDAERGHLAWLRAALIAVRDARRQRTDGLHLATPPGTRFTVNGAVATVLGPRDDAWLERALADPRVAADVWPWVADAMDAQYLLNRALCLMWLEVRWRPPATPEEIELSDEVLGLLRRAYPLEPGLAWPWAAWRELFTLRGERDPATRQLLDRGAGFPGDADAAIASEAIGYRRHPVTIVHEGWAADVPGTFTETRTEEEWSGGESGRTVTLAGVETAERGQPMSPDLFLRQVAGHLGRDVIEHDDGVVRGRARLFSDTTSGIEVATVEGFSATRGRGAAIRIVIDDPQDWKWALDTWRGLRPA